MKALATLIALSLAACAPGGDDAVRDAPAEPGSAAAVVARWRLAGSPLDPPLPRPDFTLTDTAGRPYDFRAETAGRLTLLFFGYTSCPDICPVHLASLDAVLARAAPDVRRAVTVVFVGVDAPRDTPERMRSFLAGFAAPFVGLTGTPESLRAAQLAAGVPPATVDETWEDGGYSVSHAGWILAITPDDLVHLRYPFGVRQTEWARDLELLARRGWPAGGDDGRIAVRDVYLTVSGDVAALYATAIEPGGGGDRLLAVTSPLAGRVRLHETTSEDGVSHMRPVDDGIPVPDGGTLRLRPGGTHAMLQDLRRTPAPGESVAATLVFESAGAVPVRALVVSPGELAARAAAVSDAP